MGSISIIVTQAFQSIQKHVFLLQLQNEHMIEHIERDILTIEEGVICQQVNCMGKMGKGLAKRIKDKWPKVYNEYYKSLTPYHEEPWLFLGAAQLITIKRDTLFVANLFAQYDYGTDYRRTEYGSLIKTFDSLKYEMQMFPFGYIGDFNIFIPYKMGCVNGGGDWSIVESIINKTLANVSGNVYICHYEK